MTTILKVIAIVVLFSSCTKNSPTEKNLQLSLEGSWKVVSINSKTVPSDVMITLNIDSTLKVNGKAACNSYFGNITKTTDSLSFGKMGSTRMLCDEEKNKWESAYVIGLTKSLKIQPSGNASFTLTNSTTTINFQKILIKEGN